MKKEVGDVYYSIEKKLNGFRRNKITMVDAEGVEWHRYDRDAIEYSVEKCTLTAILVKTLRGAADISDYHDDFALRAEYFMEYENGALECWDDEDFITDVFKSEANANNRMEALKKERKEWQ